MLFLSDRLTSASGSIGGTTFSHNRFGQYTRARRKPVNPNTAFQQSQRDSFASGTANWRSLSAVQRESWEVYAAASPTVNKLGQTVHLTGQQQYTASFSFATRLGLTPVTTAPSTPGKLAIGSPAVVIDASALTVAITLLDVEDDVDVAAFVGSPISAGVAFFAGPYQLRGSGQVATGAVTLSAQTGRNAFPYVAGQRIPYRLAGINIAGATTAQHGALTTIASGIVTVVA